MNEWPEMPDVPAMAPGPTGDGRETISSQTYNWYFKQCADNQAILNQIHVVVPVRPQDASCCNLNKMLSIWYGEGTSWSYLNDHMGGYIEETRANIAYSFLHGNTEKWLLMIDNDMEPPINLPYLLARHDQPIVGAPAMSVSLEHGPQLCFTIKDVNGLYRFPAVKNGQRIPARGLKEVGHVGTGALLIRRDVLEKFSFSLACRCGYVVPYERIKDCENFGQIAVASECPDCKTGEHIYEDIPFVVPFKYKLHGMRTGNLTLGEDIAFCNQARAKGFKMYVDLEAHTAHRKTVALSWDEGFRDMDLDPESWVLPPAGYRIHSL
jgi:hypothetical protein